MRHPTLVTASLAVHVVLGIALFVSGFWHLEQLHAARRPFDLAVVQRPPPSSPGSARHAAMRALAPKHHRHIVKEPVQPTPKPAVTPPPAEPVEAPPGADAGSGAGSGTGPGSAAGSGAGSGSGSGTCPAPPCGETPQQPPHHDPPPFVPPHVIRALRISGETQIQPPDPVKTAMLRDGHHRTTALIELCLGTVGEVRSVKLVKSTGYPAYDTVLADAVRAWRYRPYELGGRPVAVCGMVTFIYAIE